MTDATGTGDPKEKELTERPIVRESELTRGLRIYREICPDIPHTLPPGEWRRRYLDTRHARSTGYKMTKLLNLLGPWYYILCTSYHKMATQVMEALTQAGRLDRIVLSGGLKQDTAPVQKVKICGLHLNAEMRNMFMSMLDYHASEWMPLSQGMYFIDRGTFECEFHAAFDLRALGLAHLQSVVVDHMRLMVQIRELGKTCLVRGSPPLPPDILQVLHELLVESSEVELPEALLNITEEFWRGGSTTCTRRHKVCRDAAKLKYLEEVEEDPSRATKRRPYDRLRPSREKRRAGRQRKRLESMVDNASRETTRGLADMTKETNMVLDKTSQTAFVSHLPPQPISLPELHRPIYKDKKKKR